MPIPLWFSVCTGEVWDSGSKKKDITKVARGTTRKRRGLGVPTSRTGIAGSSAPYNSSGLSTSIATDDTQIDPIAPLKSRIPMDDCLVNFDILAYIISLSRCRRTRAVITRTCRFLRQSCSKYLIDETMWFQEEYTMWGFWGWICGDARNRAPFIRGLDFTGFTFHDPKVAGRLLARNLSLLSPFLSISRLTIDDADVFLGSHPDLIPAIAGLTTLTDIALYDVGDNARALLRSSRAALNTVVAEAEIGVPDVRVRPVDTDPTIILASQTRSLTSLTVLRMNVSLQGVRFPKVTCLVLKEMPLPLTRAYVHAFPNLRKLSIFGERWSEDPSESWLTPSFEGNIITSRRWLNMRRQQRRGTWSSLSHYEGSPVALYALGLTFNIPYVSLIDEDETSGDFLIDIQLFQDILLPVCPAHLLISFTGATQFLEEDFFPFLSCLEGLSSLKLTIVPMWLDNIFVDDFLEPCVNTLSGLPCIATFAFFISCAQLSYTYNSQSRRSRNESVVGEPLVTPICPFDASMQGYDFDKFAMRCLGAAPSLHDVVVGLDKHYSIDDVTIRVKRDVDETTHKRSAEVVL
ncbi:hypothetical protein C8Q79DRAFT_930527 [Trametes meyenii]|nr:hypothetical protein C8Q79DRAFT_930527 [Trametes meyenii]